MALHGGLYQNYYSRSSVTHIVCGNLPDAKVKHYERERQAGGGGWGGGAVTTRSDCPQ